MFGRRSKFPKLNLKLDYLVLDDPNDARVWLPVQVLVPVSPTRLVQKSLEWQVF